LLNTSTIWPTPVAPIGCPLDLRPPEGLIEIEPFSLVSPFRAAVAPVPFLKNPRSSVSTTSATVNQS